MIKIFLSFVAFFIISFAFSQNNIIVNNLGLETTISENNSNFVNSSLKSLVWSNAEKISGYPNEDSRDISIAVSADSTIHVVYCDDVPGLPSIARQKITYTKKVVGEDWTTPIIIDEFDGVTPRNDHEATVAVSPNGDVHVAYHYWAYDGTGRNQVTYSKYTNITDTWSTEIISGDSGHVYATYSDYPTVASTDNNIPVVAWGNDNTNNYDEAYLTYNNGTWQTPILISSADSNLAQFPDLVPIGGEKVFVLFREYNVAKDTLSLYYRIFDANDGSLTEIKKINASERESTSNYDSYYLYDACYNNNDSVFIALNSVDSIIGFYYDIINDTLIKTEHEFRTNVSYYANYNLLSVTADNEGTIHIGYTIWNTNSNSIKYVKYNRSEGFSNPQIISTNDAIDEPKLVYGPDNNIHFIYADDHEDTNNDGYVDREVYYVFSDITSKISSPKISNNNIKVFPNPSNSGIFNIETNEILNITILSTNGQIIYNGTSNSVIDLSGYNDGIYILKAENNKTNYFTKLIKQ